MPSPYHAGFPERMAMDHESRPALRTKSAKPTLNTSTWNAPKPPGGPRKVHKAHGRKVKIAPQGDT